MSQFNNPKFKKLQNTWYKKLEKSGFEDIEDHRTKDEKLKSWHSMRFFLNYESGTRWRAKETYFQNALWFLENYCFDTSKDKRIWACHAEGLSIRETAKKLNYSRTIVFRAIKRLRSAMNGNKD